MNQPIDMKRNEVYKWMDKMFGEIMVGREKSAAAYAKADSRPFSNFESQAEAFKTTPEFALMFQASKHWDFIREWILASPSDRAAMEEREPVEGRIKDLVLFMGLMYAMIHEPNSTRFVADYERTEEGVRSKFEFGMDGESSKWPEIPVDGMVVKQGEVHITFVDGVTRVALASNQMRERLERAGINRIDL